VQPIPLSGWLEFNSLHAQRDACEAYIKSQASQGWRVLPQHYDDPAYSGGNLDRPALRQLLKDIDAGRIDVIVVYKIDRLTGRSPTLLSWSKPLMPSRFPSSRSLSSSIPRHRWRHCRDMRSSRCPQAGGY
jgi:hypothetical protein